jgi:hypothetical protein
MRDKVKLSKQLYREKNKEGIKISETLYRKQKEQKIKVSNSLYYAENKDNSTRLYYENNKSKYSRKEKCLCNQLVKKREVILNLVQNQIAMKIYIYLHRTKMIPRREINIRGEGFDQNIKKSCLILTKDLPCKYFC